jgi:hypothetical protein
VIAPNNQVMPFCKSHKSLLLIPLCAVLVLSGCNQKIDGYAAVSSITNNGFARTGSDLPSIQGQEIKVWGFVDHSNIYGDEAAKQILGDWWSGAGPNATTWRFNLMAEEQDQGHSFAIYVPNDQGRDELLKAFLADARAQKPTQVFVQGQLFSFAAPTNVNILTGLYIEVDSSRDVLLEPPSEQPEGAYQSHSTR